MTSVPAIDVRNAARTATERSSVYGLLAAAFRSEPDAELLARLCRPEIRAGLVDAGVALDFDGLDGPDDDVLEALGLEFTALFVGPGDHAAPYASVYLGGEGASLWGPETVWVRRFIENAGFDFRAEYHGFPDHISVEMEFMAEMTAREAAALDGADTSTAATCRHLQREFVGDHMAKWIPPFCDKVVRGARMPFYDAFARLGDDFVEDEAAYLEQT